MGYGPFSQSRPPTKQARSVNTEPYNGYMEASIKTSGGMWAFECGHTLWLLKAPASVLWPILRATSHTRLRAHALCTSSNLIGGYGSEHSHWWIRQSGSKFASHYAWGTNGVCECKMDVKFTWIPTWHRMDHVSWSLGLFFKTHFLEVGLTQNQETMTLRNVHNW